MTPTNFKSKMLIFIDRFPPQHQEEARRKLDALQRMGCDSLDGLIDVFQNPEAETELRLFACNALKNFRYKRAVKVMLTTFQDMSENRDVRLMAGVSLGFLGSKRALRSLISILKNHIEIEMRERAAYALGWLFDERAVEPLMKTLEDVNENEKVRAQAAEALGLFADARPVETLTALVDVLLANLQDPSPLVRFWVAYALANCHDPRAIPALEKLAAEDTSLVPGWRSVSQEATDAITEIRRWTKNH